VFERYYKMHLQKRLLSAKGLSDGELWLVGRLVGLP
jgi:hypothetical protein